jgi:hypothetical protein
LSLKRLFLPKCNETKLGFNNATTTYSFPKPAESDVKEFTFSLELFN